MQYHIAAFGEAEKGKLSYPYFINSLSQLIDQLGNPPEDTYGLHYAVQALMYERDLIFFRVEEEGFSENAYIKSLSFLENKEDLGHVDALCMPGVGNKTVIDTAIRICSHHKSFLIITEKDLYDYLTSVKS